MGIASLAGGERTGWYRAEPSPSRWLPMARIAKPLGGGGVATAAAVAAATATTATTVPHRVATSSGSTRVSLTAPRTSPSRLSP
eukprot:7487929-Pyramimonas_sp.AAC.1